MARLLALDKSSTESNQDLARRLECAPLQHADALMSGLGVLQALHDRGVLELVKGALGSSDQVLEILVRAAGSPEAIRGIRNLLVLAKVLGSIDPELLEKFTLAIPDALAEAAKVQQTEAPGFWEILKLLRSQDFRHGLGITNSLLKALAKGFSTKS